MSRWMISTVYTYILARPGSHPSPGLSPCFIKLFILIIVLFLNMGNLHTFTLVLFLLNALFCTAFASILFDPVHDTCGPNGAAGGAEFLSDVANMAKSALKITNDAHTLQTRERYRVMAAYNAFFDATSLDSQNRWNEVQGQQSPHQVITKSGADLTVENLRVMAALDTNSQHNVYVQCDDAHLWSLSQDGLHKIFRRSLQPPNLTVTNTDDYFKRPC